MSIENLRNIVIAGGQGTGKTSLVELILYKVKVTGRRGRVEEGTTLSDYDEIEKRRRFSINPSLFHFSWKNHKINLLDMPGFSDFVDKIRFALRGVEAAIVVTSPSEGITSETRRVFQYLTEEKMPFLIFINKIEEGKINFSQFLQEIEKEAEIVCLPLQFPLTSEGNFSKIVNLWKLDDEDVKIPSEFQDEIREFRKKLLEVVAETDDSLIEKYLETEKLSKEELEKGLKDGTHQGNFVPVMCGSVLKDIGIESLLDAMVNILPSPLIRDSVRGSCPGKEGEVERKISMNEPLSAFIFQTLTEEHLGEINFFKVYSGKLSSGSTVYNSTQKEEEKIGQVYLVQGREREEVSQVIAGDIGALTKLKNTYVQDTICDPQSPITFPPVPLLEPTTSIALKPVSRKDEQKMSLVLARLVKEDPFLRVEVDKESKQTILSGMGEVHLEITIERLKNKFNLQVEKEVPRIPYRETITTTSEAQGKYKRQTGGHGQYGDVWLRVKPLPRGEGFKFVDAIKGGVVPSRYIPAVEKGVKEALKKGVLASYPLIDIEVTLFDGSHHPVDSSDIAFQIAGSMGVKKAVEQANPILLEPIAELEVEVPNEFLGEINGDLNSRRGKIIGVESYKGREKIKAHVPLSELHNYSASLRSLTQGRGIFRRRISHYERVPEEVAQKIINQATSSNKQ